MSETIRVYGSTRSRAMRVLWMCRELNLEFEQVDIMPGGAEARAPDFRAKHPMGKIPVLEMPDGFVLFESAAIVTYLGDLHPASELVPRPGTRERGLYEQWMSFALTELDAPLWTRALHTFALPEHLRAEAALPAASAVYSRGRAVVEAELDAHPHILGEAFSAVDIVIAQTLLWGRGDGLEPHGPNVEAYLKRVKSRSAFQRALGR